VVAILALLGAFASAQTQSRKLGPDTAKSILDAKLDPAFQTTKLDRVLLLPFANTAQFKEAAGIISKTFVSQLSQLHSEYKFIRPDEAMNFITTSNLDDQFNVFLGDYIASATARPDFLSVLREKLQIDAVFMGQITKWGEEKETGISIIKLPTIRTIYVVGMEMSLYRTTDGRRIWYGKDLIQTPKKDKMPEAAQVISNVFARFFGRLPY
jgi:hypothetical protein